jgi:5-methyltetrahydrofolate--homocysteine methyltransferase
VTCDLRDPSAGELEALAAKRVLVKAGPTGTVLRALGLRESEFRGERFAGAARPLAGNYDVLVLTQPAVIERVHREYLAAGADLIETNTFSAQAVSQRKFGLKDDELYELNLMAARLSRRIADRFSELDPTRPRFVIGNLGPSELSSSRTPPGAERDRELARVRAAYAQQARALIEGGVHALLLETVYDEVTAQACVRGIRDSLDAHGCRLPLMVSFTPARDGRMASGRELTEVLAEFEFARPWCAGVNCGFGPESVRKALEAVAGSTPCLVGAYPNAGLPDASGHHPEATELASRVADWASRGLLNLVGGCCGTTPRHVRELATAVQGFEPRGFERRPPRAPGATSEV